VTTQPTKEKVTLDDLKQAIEAVPPPGDGKRGPDPLGLMHYEHMRGEAWRTACQWLLQYVSTHGDQYPTFMEGINLIREKLQS